MSLLDKGEADILNVDPEDLYLAGRLYGLEPFLVEEYNGSKQSLIAQYSGNLRDRIDS